jgi:hypothetical protein
VSAALRRHPALQGRPVKLAASRRLTVPALCAAALDPKIQALYLSGGLVSFASIMRTDNYRHPLSNIAPRFLDCTDLPELAAKLAPRPVLLAGAVDGQDDTLDEDAVLKAYGAAVQAGNLRVSAKAEWTVASLTAWAKSS